MPKIILDAAMTADGFWADAHGRSVFPIEEMRAANMLPPLIARTGAVVWSVHSSSPTIRTGTRATTSIRSRSS